MTFQEITAELSAEIGSLNEIIAKALHSEDTPLMNEITGRYLQTKGKQIRPVMVMLCSRMFGDIDGQVLHAAASLELLHNASLIHDDVVDETKRRRGRDTINAVWDNHIAVLVGDFFVSAALAEAVRTNNLEIVKSLSALGKELSQGEIHQICNARDHSFLTDSYFTAIHKKTASLFMHCALVGANAHGIDYEEARPLIEYAEMLGLCFQIRDDIFDYFPSVQTGKPSGNDLREGKVTLPLLAVLERAGEARRTELLDRLSRCREDEAEVEYLRRTVEDEGGIAAAGEIMQQYLAQAAGLLAGYEPSDYRTALIDLCAYVAERDR